jgi:hypothetical protein
MIGFEFLGELLGFPLRTQRLKSLDRSASADLLARATALNRRERGGKAAEFAEKCKQGHSQGQRHLRRFPFPANIICLQFNAQRNLSTLS